MVNFGNWIEYYGIGSEEILYKYMHDKSVYEFEYPDDIIDPLTANIIAGNMLSKVDSEGHHYRALTEVTYHKRGIIVITNVDGFIKSSNFNLHQKWTTRFCKLVI